MYTARGIIDKSHMLEAYLPMVRKIAAQMLGRLPANVEMDDLVQAGRLGLIEAWQRYRQGTTASFETYASQRIRGAMMDELRSIDWAPRRIRQQAKAVEAAIHGAAQKHGRTPTEAEIAEQMGLTLAQYHERLVDIQGCQLLYAEDFDGEDDASDEGDDDGDRADAEGDPLALMQSAEVRARLIAAIKTLPTREAHILSLYYEEDLNLREIADVLGVTRGRASQLHSQAITRLRVALTELL